MKKIRLYWYGGENGEVNFGDSLSPLIIRHLSGKEVVYSGIGRCDLVSTGSLLDMVVEQQWRRLINFRFSSTQLLPMED